MKSMEALIGIFASVTLLWLVYWGLLRSALLNVVKDDLDALRSRVDWAIIEGREGSQSEACHQLEFVLRHSQLIWFVSFSQFVVSMWIKRREIAALRAERSRLFNESPAWIRETQKNCAWLFIRAALLNSPACGHSFLCYCSHLNYRVRREPGGTTCRMGNTF